MIDLHAVGQDLRLAITPEGRAELGISVTQGVELDHYTQFTATPLVEQIERDLIDTFGIDAETAKSIRARIKTFVGFEALCNIAEVGYAARVLEERHTTTNQVGIIGE